MRVEAEKKTVVTGITGVIKKDKLKLEAIPLTDNLRTSKKADKDGKFNQWIESFTTQSGFKKYIPIIDDEGTATGYSVAITVKRDIAKAGEEVKPKKVKTVAITDVQAMIQQAVAAALDNQS